MTSNELESTPARDSSIDDPRKGLAIYRLVRWMCTSVLLVPVAFGAAVALNPLSRTIGDALYAIFFVSAVITPFITIAGLVIGIVAGARDQLSDDVDRKMWRLVAVVVGGYVVLYAIAQ